MPNMRRSLTIVGSVSIIWQAFLWIWKLLGHIGNVQTVFDLVNDWPQIWRETVLFVTNPLVSAGITVLCFIGWLLLRLKDRKNTNPHEPIIEQPISGRPRVTLAYASGPGSSIHDNVVAGIPPDTDVRGFVATGKKSSIWRNVFNLQPRSPKARRIEEFKQRRARQIEKGKKIAAMPESTERDERLRHNNKFVADFDDLINREEQK